MKTCTATLEGVSTYSQSAPIRSKRGENEDAHQFEEKTWRERIHADEDGNVFIPPMAFKNCMTDVAMFLSMKIKGQGQATFTKHFKAGVLVTEPPVLGIKRDEVKGEWLFLPSDGKAGSGKRVWKCYPMIPKWKAEVVFHVISDKITEEIFETHLRQAGNFVGIGRFRPIRNGYYGRFRVLDVKWS